MLKRIIMVLLVLFVVAQFVPKALFPISNPRVDETKTLHARVRKLPPPVDAILNRSCADCHSDQTVWPWYSKFAPISWLLSRDVAEGRRAFNMSDWARYRPQAASRKLKEICEQVQRGEMPLWYYKPLHPDSKLSEADIQAICAWAREEAAAAGAGVAMTGGAAR
jgi:cytochrome c553